MLAWKQLHNFQVVCSNGDQIVSAESGGNSTKEWEELFELLEEREDSPLPSPNAPSTQSGVPVVQDETLTVKLTCDSETTNKEVEKEAKTSGMVNITLFLMRY